ncbi:MAG TPA: 4Fe-4S binding protein [Bacillota bacterium]|nr:4Fe-4S binding protein [Bacillota bacterium]
MKILIRRIVQLVVAALLTYLFLMQDYISAVRPFFTWISWLDPLTGLASLRGQWPWLIVISIAALGLVLWRRRFFCGWLCPVGTILDCLGFVKHFILQDHFPGAKTEKWLNRLRWAVFGGVLGFVLLGHTIVLAFDPLVLWPREINRVINHLIPWSIIGLSVLAFIFFPRFWCRFICPAGSTLSLIGRLKRQITPNDSCTHCGLCKKRCPNRNINEDIQFGSDCLDCGACRQNCPKKALSTPVCPQKVSEGRRDLIVAAGVGLGVVALEAASKSLQIKTVANPSWNRLLRPPGALHEDSFVATCNRCGECINVCPSSALVPTGLEAGLAGLATPRFLPRRGRCMLDSCLACSHVCPTGALAPIPKEELVLGKAQINHDRCIVWEKHRRCLLCVEVCPTFALSIDAQGRPVVDKNKCVGCGACEAGCPVDGAAIRVYNKGEKRR